MAKQQAKYCQSALLTVMMTPTQVRSDFISLIVPQIFMLSIISWLIVVSLKEIKPFTADRFQDVLMINRKKVGSVSALQSLEIQLRPGKSSIKLYALVSHSRKPEGRRYLIATGH